jgi:hypothetical protein
VGWGGVCVGGRGARGGFGAAATGASTWRIAQAGDPCLNASALVLPCAATAGTCQSSGSCRRSRC